MAKLAPTKPKIVIKKLQKLGFVKDHQSGSHIVMYHPKTKKRAVIPYHLKDLPKGTLSHILKEAGVFTEDFKES